MAGEKWVLCVTNSRFDYSIDQTVHAVARPLQLFDTKFEAEHAMELFFEFYEGNLAVRPGSELTKEFL